MHSGKTKSEQHDIQQAGYCHRCKSTSAPNVFFIAGGNPAYSRYGEVMGR
jgi:hypothetical protein